jgi:N-acetylneuraminic acid mutarotase
MALLGRELHFIGGLKKDRQTDSGDHWVLSLDCDGEWTPKAPLPEPRNHFGIETIQGQIYVLGGEYGHDVVAGELAASHANDPLTDSWRELAPLPKPRSHFEPGTFAAAVRFVIVGGRTPTDEVLYDITAYDPVRDVWEELPGLPFPLRSPVAKAIGNEVIIGQGGAPPQALMMRCTWASLGLKDTVSRK